MIVYQQFAKSSSQAKLFINMIVNTNTDLPELLNLMSLVIKEPR